jgi:hypothetical protein
MILHQKAFLTVVWVAVVAVTGCSSWQEQEPHPYDQRTQQRAPVAFRNSTNPQQDVRYRVQRPNDEVVQNRYYAGGRGEGARYNPYAYGSRYTEVPRGNNYYDDRVGWDTASGYRESSESRAAVNTTDPIQRQWNNLRSGSTRPTTRWNNSTTKNEGYRDYDSLLGADRVSSDTLRAQSRAADGYKVNYEALAPGSRLAEEQRRAEEEAARRRAEEVRLQEERRLARQTPVEVPARRTTTVGTDLPRAMEVESSRIIPLREVASAEIKKQPVTTGVGASATLTPGGSVYEKKNEMTLAQLLGEKGPLSLRGATARAQIPVNISPRLKVDEWSLRLVYTHSSLIVPGQSQITISVDRTIVAQVEMVPDQPYNTVDIPLPKELANTRGAHEIQIAVSQPLPAGVDEVQRFTQINLESSYIRVKGHMTPVTARLSELPKLFDYRMIGEQYPIHLTIPGSFQMNESMLKWGSSTAQAVGLRTNQLPLKLTHGDRLRNNQDNILIGQVSDIAPFLEGNLANQIHGAFIGIQPLYHDDRHFMIILTGRNYEEVQKAVEAFAIIPEERLAESSYFEVKEVRLDTAAGTIPVGKPPVKVPGTYTFSQLGSFSRTMELVDSEYRVNVNLPGDYQSSATNPSVLEVHFTPPGISSERAFLQVFVGDLFVGDISMGDGGDGTLRKRSISLAPHTLRAGENQIRLVYRTAASSVRASDRMEPVTILDSSMLIFPSSTGTRELPNLSLLSRSGFPLTDIHQPGDLTLYITDGNPMTVDSAWTFMSKIAQVSGSYLLGVDITFVRPEAPRNLVVIGLWSDLTDARHEGASLFGGRNILEYRVSRTNPFDSEKPTRSLFSRVQGTFDGQPQEQAPVNQHRLSLGVGAEVPQTVMMSQYENPLRRGYLVTMIAAGTAQALYDGMLRIQEPIIWNGMRGEMMMLSQYDGQPTYAPSQDLFAYRGEFEFKKAVVPILWGDTWVQVLIILGALLLLAVGTAIWIRRTTYGHEYVAPSSNREDEL